MNSTRVNANGALNYSQRSTVVPTEEGELKSLLQRRTNDGFATSAYWGATGEVPPRESDNHTGRLRFRFDAEINRKLVPLPKVQTSIPRTLDYTLKGLHLLTDVVDKGKPELNAAQLATLKSGDATIEQTPHGLSVKPRFLNLKTTTQRMPGKLSDEVAATLAAGEGAEDALKKELEELKSTKFTTPDPNPYRLTSDDYCDMSGIDPSSYRVTEWDPEHPDCPLDVYKSRYNNVEREGPKRRARTLRMLEREHLVDPTALRLTLNQMSADALPKGYAPHSAKDWMSTTHREHATYDTNAATDMNDPNSTNPVRNVNYRLTPAHHLAVSQHEKRHTTRHDGSWATEYADGYQDRFDQAEVDKNFSGRSIFDIQSGIYTMHHHAHHPRGDTATGESFSPPEVVPGQYTSMATEPLPSKNTRGTGVSFK